jgi:hypothetical protein
MRRRNGERMKDGLKKDRNGKNHCGVRSGNFTFFLAKRPSEAGFDLPFCVRPSPESVICDIVPSSTSFKLCAPG